MFCLAFAALSHTSDFVLKVGNCGPASDNCNPIRGAAIAILPASRSYALVAASWPGCFLPRLLLIPSRTGAFILVKTKELNMLVGVISDIHGEYDLFMKMLEKIKFQDTDTLYILGDILDRGPNPIQLLRRLMELSLIHI